MKIFVILAVLLCIAASAAVTSTWSVYSTSTERHRNFYPLG